MPTASSWRPSSTLRTTAGRSFTVSPFFRYDATDPRRTHADLREAYLLLFGEIGEDEWELRLGIDRVFWGVAESRNLVDIVNQTDLVEHPDGMAKLGQPMVHATWYGDWGVAEFLALPYHRARTFPGRAGRLRAPILVDADRIVYEHGAGARHLDFAARYSHGFGPLDLGVSVFDGTSREPLLLPALGPRGVPVLVPIYEQIRQFGLDAQVTTGSWLLKLEAIRRAGARNREGIEQNYAAFVGGAEYTFYSVFDTAADLSILGELNHDTRGRHATNQIENDLFGAARLALNDVQSTEFLVSILGDMDTSTRAVTFEFNRRLSDQWSLQVEALALLSVDKADALVYPIRRDSFLALNLTYNF